MMTSSLPETTALPSARQLQYQDWEFGVFLHFGIRTFYEGHKDWDDRPMPPDAFLPSALNCDQWVQTARQAGARYMVFTAKHHDGFANWPSRFTRYSVAAAPWRAGRGDVVREYVEACRRHDMKIGLYYSPADASCPVYKDPVAYDDYFIGQISEILTGYGHIDILWFDGCGSEGHQYDWPRITREIRRMQPNLLIFSMGDPDFRWVGNEDGMAPVPCWNTVSAVSLSVRSAEAEHLAGGARWLPAECDCKMRDENWFYSDADAHTVKSLNELMALYDYSIGRGCNLLVNIGPDRRGLLPDADARRLLEFGYAVRQRFSNPLVTLADAVQDGTTLTWTFPNGIFLDHVVLQEELTRGEHVRRFEIEIGAYPEGQPISVWQGQNIGHKAVCRFPLARAVSVTVRICEAQGQWQLRAAELHDCSSPSALIVSAE